MSIRETLKKDRETLRGVKVRKERLQFIWDYYKIPIIAFAVLVCILITVIAESASRRPVILYSYLVNTVPTVEERDEQIFDRLLAEGGINTEGRSAAVDASLSFSHGADGERDAAALQVLNAGFGISDLDFFAADEETFMIFAAQDAFADLSKLLDADYLASHGSDLVHSVNSDGVDTVCGIILHPGSPLHRAGYYSGDAVVGIAALAENMEEAFVLLRGLCGA